MTTKIGDLVEEVKIRSTIDKLEYFIVAVDANNILHKFLNGKVSLNQ